ncbi:MAG: DUF4349 domain-containing protein [Candidatus Pacebacteria bacterium]|nr:DUF4349 domain-containing protein [Candidatus Paceibacterota bacterium]PIR63621.1 MAG: hypothetical protein COU64_03430 [Candidatus Pacebacteria bacterium CG10_big_fil_rev_8_21_14_0_10_40_26]PIZ78723.1 MAG: hypothetical protein COY01_03800 [Candidatus Pacebacteria bacterium CG_4_10_14_0_2_um_filter_40_20]PJA68425.1 MAG: hypothetical protein CO156_05515 [Candidatus Pacebacteria bacterium CG_4_9_14_3_um_filter_40_12]PJC41287.1 MAG: hypothetical protein CO041_05585 [Candidatus Pacebacteria bact
MQKQKKILFVGFIAILVLAGATTYFKANRNRWQYMIEYGTDAQMLREPMMADSAGGFGGGMMEAGVATSKIAVDSMPSNGGMMPPYYYGDDSAGLDAEYRLYDRSANYDVIVKDVQTYLRSMREYVLSIDGVVLNDSFNQGDDWKAGSLYVKVPVAKFSEASDRAVEGVKEVFGSSSNSADITGSHVTATDRVAEVETMIADTKASLEASQALLDQAEAGTTEWRQYRSEVLQLENRLSSYERQLEQYQKNVDSVEGQAEYASIMINASDSKRYFDPNTDLPLSEHIKRALASLGESGYLVASFLIWVVVYSVIWLPILGVYLWLTGRGGKKK